MNLHSEIRYRGYSGSVEYSADDGCLFGKIQSISDIITYEGDTLEELKQAFKYAVDEYLLYCEVTGKSANIPFKGTTNSKKGKLEMSNVKTLMEVSIQDLAKKKHDAFKAHVLSILSEVTKLVQECKYDEVKNYLGESPAGDDHGCDNSFINFHWDEQLIMDIADAVELLSNLRKST